MVAELYGRKEVLPYLRCLMSAVTADSLVHVSDNSNAAVSISVLSVVKEAKQKSSSSSNSGKTVGNVKVSNNRFV
jgi:hypothetical protein